MDRYTFQKAINEDIDEILILIQKRIKRMDETDLVEFTEKKVVLIIDEVDKSCNNQLFLDFLGMLRSKYLLKNEGKEYNKLFKIKNIMRFFIKKLLLKFIEY